MPKKNIYIKDADLQLFDRAEQLGEDSLSQVIAESVRRFVAIKEAEGSGMEEVSLEVGTLRGAGEDDDTRTVRFVGRLLADALRYTGQTSDGRDRGTDYRIYQTQAGKILVWWKAWTRWQGENDLLDYAICVRLPGYDTEISGKIHGEQMPETLPANLLREAAETLGQELVEWVE